MPLLLIYCYLHKHITLSIKENYPKKYYYSIHNFEEVIYEFKRKPFGLCLIGNSVSFDWSFGLT